MKTERERRLPRMLAAACLAACGTTVQAQSPMTELVSVTIDEEEVNGDCFYSAISENGRFVAFATFATNLFEDDANGRAADVVLRDLQTQESILVSKDSEGIQANGASEFPAVSGDGTFVAFQSQATNLVEDDTNGLLDVFRHNRVTGETVLVSANGNGEPGNGPSEKPSISRNGSRVVFLSSATNLDPVYGPTNGAVQVFVKDLNSKSATLVSVGLDGVEASSGCSFAMISGNGRFVAFTTAASLIGNKDGNDRRDVYLRDLSSPVGEATLILVSRRDNGTASNGSSRNPAIDFAGDRVAFDSSSQDLAGNPFTSVKRRVFVYEKSSGAISLVSRSTAGAPADASSDLASISSDGRYVCFSTASANLVDDDTNGKKDVFLHDVLSKGTTRASIASDRTQGDDDSTSIYFSLAKAGTVLAFRSRARNLVDGVTSSVPKIYAHRSTLDFQPPAIICPPDITTECTGDGSAVVEFEVSVDDEDPAPVVEVDPPSGSSFPVGTTVVNVTATDSSGNSASCSFQVTVTDAISPQIQCPAPFTVACTSSSGARVEFEVTAVDACDPTPVVITDPRSGSTFPPGETTVNCVATDAAGNQAACSFVVTVKDNPVFLRGDSNGDLRVDVSDAVFSLRYLFAGGDEPPCLEAADVNDDAEVSLTDPIYLLNFLAHKIAVIPDPGGRASGPDPTPDDLGCGTPKC